jgi:hypothetical protein
MSVVRTHPIIPSLIPQAQFLLSLQIGHLDFSLRPVIIVHRPDAPEGEMQPLNIRLSEYERRLALRIAEATGVRTTADAIRLALYAHARELGLIGGSIQAEPRRAGRPPRPKS